MVKQDDDNVIDDQDEQPTGPPPSLDQVHAANQNFVEEEDAENEDQPEGDDTLSEDDDSDGEGDDQDNGGDEATGDEDASEDEDEDPSDDQDGSDEDPSDEPERSTPPTPDPLESASELDEDITKPGKDKVEIRDEEGTKFYFNSLDEVPDTFQPLSYKELMKGVSNLNKKEAADQVAADEQLKNYEAREHEARTQALTDNWENEAKELTESGYLPKGKDNESAKEAVYDYMEKEMKAGNPIRSFKQAYKSMKYDEAEAEKVVQQKKLDAAKKKRGGMVQGGSGGSGDGSSNIRKNKVIEAAPTGTSLDRIHDHIVSEL